MPATAHQTVMRRCLLSGASGYLGSRIKERLTADGWQVTELSRRSNPGIAAIEFKLGEPMRASELAGYCAIIHCAYDFTKASWKEIHATNVHGSELLLRAAKEANVEHQVFISTISAFQSCQSLYGKAKLETERIARSLGAWVIRPGLIHGSSPAGMYGRLVENIKHSRILPIPGNGMQLMYLVHEADVTKAVLRCLRGDRPASEVPVTVAHEQPWSFRSIVLEIAKGLERQIILVPIPWRAVWLGLRLAEIVNLPVGFRSDSLISLINQNLAPVFNAEKLLGVRCRPFQASVSFDSREQLM
jgi:nucleoside-diphosphate-sugar epimerase